MPAPSRLFLDTSFIQGLYNKTDQYHTLCNASMNYVNNIKEIYTTDFILAEIGNAFSSVNHRQAGSKIIDGILKSTQIKLIYNSPLYTKRILELYTKMKDKEWGFTDCFSIIVMKELDIKSCLTTDHHFKQAGFKILPF